MSSPESAIANLDSSRVRDRTLWNAAQQLMAGHLSLSPDETRCANPQCDPDAGYPCSPARTAMDLAAASHLPLYKRLTALSDAGTCVVPPSHFGLATAGGSADDWRVTSALESSSPLAGLTAFDAALMSAVDA